MIGHRVADHAARVQIDDHGEVKPAFPGPYVRDVAYPRDVRCRYGELPFEQIRCCWLARGSPSTTGCSKRATHLWQPSELHSHFRCFDTRYRGGGRVWSQSGSNRRPLECHSSALPAELWPRIGNGVISAGRRPVNANLPPSMWAGGTLAYKSGARGAPGRAMRPWYRFFSPAVVFSRSAPSAFNPRRMPASVWSG